MASTVILKAAGLQTSQNELSRPEGSLIEASNVNIRRDGIIEQRRGFNLYGDAFPSINDRAKQLTTYRDRILRHYSSSLQFDNDGAGQFLDFDATIQEVQTGLRIKFIESNGNLYFTTADGIKKLSARNSGDFTTDAGFVTDAGAVKALDATGKVLYVPNSQSAWFPQDAAVAYRILWAYKDLNDNLVQGTPSQRLVVGNPMMDFLLQDYMRLLYVLDTFQNTPLTTARINDDNYIETLGLDLTASDGDLYTNLIALTKKIDEDILYADQAATAPLQMGVTPAVIAGTTCTITFTSGNPSLYFEIGSNIFLSGFSPATGTLNGGQVVTTVNATTLTFETTATGAVTVSSGTIVSNEYRSLTVPTEPSIPATNAELVSMQDYISDIIIRLGDEPTTVISATDQLQVATLDVTTTATVLLNITIPEGINSNYFFQIYRSPVSQATGAGTFDDLVPSDELQLVYEAYPTAEEFEAGTIEVEDVTPDAFRGANLYTNASTGEGILQANEQPPFAKDINRYKNSIFYANTRTKHKLDLSLLGVQGMINDLNDFGIEPRVTIASDSTKNTYLFVIGQAQYVQLLTVADVANSLNGKYFLISSATEDFYVWYDTNGLGVDPLIAGRTGVKVILTTGDSANNVAYKTFQKLSTYLEDFVVDVAANILNITNLDTGYCLTPTIGTSGFTLNTYTQGTGEAIQSEITNITVVAGSNYVSSGSADHFLIYSAFDQNRYLVWFKRGTATDPNIGGYTSIQINITGAETAPQVALLVAAALPAAYFETSVLSNVVTVTNAQSGFCQPVAENVANVGFTVTQVQEGKLQVLLSPSDSPAIAVDETARSFVRVINKNSNESIYAYYLSGNFDVPGKMLFEARTLTQDGKFYVVGSNDTVGASFNPDIGPELEITAIGTGNNPQVTTSTPHGFLTGDQVILTATDSIPFVDGVYTVTYISGTVFALNDAYVNIAGSTGAAISVTNAVSSENEEKINRVYYSKFSQPEAVPLVNYFDVGASDKAILRVMPLRDSMFVFKEDGLYRISGESAPFQLQLFDNSFITLAPDSVTVCNNVIYAWTTQGIQAVTENGTSIISRVIDNIILRTQSSNYTNFKTSTWGIGYDSDNSYLVFTVSDVEDEFATICYRYCTLTNTWTTYNVTKRCGVVNSMDDKLYLGPTDISFIEQERKTFSRLDYADRELSTVISFNKLIGTKIILPAVTGMAVGDVFVQDQTITTTEFNILLEKLDFDSGVSDGDYLATLELVAGESPRSKLTALATKLDNDPGVVFTNYLSSISTKSGSITSTTAADATIITSAAHGLITGRVIIIDSSTTTPLINGTYQVTVIDANTFSIPARVTVESAGGNWATVDSDFQDLKTCYNEITRLLNLDQGVSFVNYKAINNNTIQEAVITAINTVTKQITLNLELQYLTGAATVFKAIQTSVTYSPVTMDDPLMLKHIREATLMFETRTFTSGIVSFATDLLPELIPVPFTMDGNGIFGHSVFGSGFFGGLSNSAPMRTYIPRQCQRCRYMVVRFTHKVAREDYRLLGITLTGELQQSTRAYR